MQANVPVEYREVIVSFYCFSIIVYFLCTYILNTVESRGFSCSMSVQLKLKFVKFYLLEFTIKILQL